MVYLKALFFLILFPGTFAVYIPYWIVSNRSEKPTPDFNTWGILGLFLVAPGIAILLWCVWDFAHSGKGTPAPIDPPKTLVVKGLYRHIRNPMYVGVLMILLGESLLYRSYAILAYASVVFLLFNAFVRLYEERALAKKFGDSYERYRNEVPRWIPRLK
jgi:protein-S-isoprenylcysteine O-methyltransferase Ste14